MNATARNTFPPSRFRLPSSATLHSRFADLRTAIRRRLLAQDASRTPTALVRRALDDAERLALDSGFPHLFFPALAEEKVNLLRGFLAAEERSRAPLRLRAAA